MSRGSPVSTWNSDVVACEPRSAPSCKRFAAAWNEMPDRISLAAQTGATIVGSIAEALRTAKPIKEVVELVPAACQLFKQQRPG
jgi:hypothetical protein